VKNQCENSGFLFSKIDKENNVCHCWVSTRTEHDQVEEEMIGQMSTDVWIHKQRFVE
jgi:hypothetical protein